MIEYETRTVSVMVIPKGDPLYSERGTTITITDEAAGEYLEITQTGRMSDEPMRIYIEPVEWPSIREAINKLIKDCRNYD